MMVEPESGERGQYMTLKPQATLEIARFLAGGPSPEQIIAFRPSPEATERFYSLIDAERAGTISDEERNELDTCISVEHMMRLVKAEAHRLLQQRAS